MRPPVRPRKRSRRSGSGFINVEGGLEARLGMLLEGPHDITAWPIEHSADLVSKPSAGRTRCKRQRGNNATKDTAKFGRRRHDKLNKKG